MVGHLKQNQPALARHGRATAWALAALAVLVTLAHLWMTTVIGQALQPPSQTESIKKIQAAYVSEMRLSRPPVARPAATAQPTPAAGKPKRTKPRQVAEAASAASSPASEVQAQADAASSPALGASAPEAFDPDTSHTPLATRSEPPPEAQAAASAGQAPHHTPQPEDTAAPTFEWPEAVRVTFKLKGNYRGPIYGQGSVEWLRQDQRYQVFLESTIGPSFAPIGSFRWSSEGEIRPEGLYPRRFEAFNRLLIRTSPTSSVVLDEQEVTLANGNKAPRTADMQDPASLFIQLAYRYMMNPQLLSAGSSVTQPVTWVNKVDVLAYDAIGEETLQTPIGEVPTVHVRPRRLDGAPNKVSVEIWFAPGLMYLPVRILTRFDDKTYMDMLMDNLPRQADLDATRKARRERPPGTR